MAGRKNRNKNRRGQIRPGSKNPVKREVTPEDIKIPPTATHPNFSLPGWNVTVPPALALCLSLLALCLLVAVSYLPAVWAGFVWDDGTITDSSEVATLSGLWDIWFSPGSIGTEAHYWPVVYTTFWLEHKLWGFAPAGYHIVNVLLHMANTLLLFRLLAHLHVPGAWVVAAVFAVHPTHVESVVWVIERKDMLSGLFYLAATGAYIRFAERHNRRFYVLALALFVLGLLSKSVVVTLPAALLIWHWWQQGRVTRADATRLLPFFLLGLGITLADLALARMVNPVISTFSWDDRVLMASTALWFYVSKLLWPTELAVIYDLRAGGWGYAVACAAVAATLWSLRHRIGRGPLAGALFFAVTLSPSLGFVDYGFMSFAFVADRFQYLAGIGVLAVLVATAVRGVERLPRSALMRAWGVWGTWAAITTLLALLGTATWRQAEIYRNPETFFSHIIALNPKAQSAHYNLGNEYRRQGLKDKALENYRIALQLEPDAYKVHNQVGLAFKSLGQLDQAEQHFMRALEIRPTFSKSLTNLAVLWMGQQRYQEALALYQTALESEPELTAAHSGMGSALLNLGRPEDALRSFERALSIDPTMQHAIDNRRRARAMLQGKSE